MICRKQNYKVFYKETNNNNKSDDLKPLDASFEFDSNSLALLLNIFIFCFFRYLYAERCISKVCSAITTTPSKIKKREKNSFWKKIWKFNKK